MFVAYILIGAIAAFILKVLDPDHPKMPDSMYILVGALWPIAVPLIAWAAWSERRERE
jgi:hypothetical protein